MTKKNRKTRETLEQKVKRGGARPTLSKYAAKIANRKEEARQMGCDDLPLPVLHGGDNG